MRKKQSPDNTSQAPEIVTSQPDGVDVQPGDVPEFEPEPSEGAPSIRVSAPAGQKWRVAAQLVPLLVPIESTMPDPANARLHPTKNLAAIAASFKKHGQLKPVVLDKDGVIAAGNGTREALLSLGWTHMAAVKTDLAHAEAVAFALADNRTAELAAWDDAVLGKHLHALQTDAPALLEDIGWNENEMKKLLGEAAGGTLDAAGRTLEATFSILIDCKDEQEQVALLEELTNRGLAVKALMT